MDSRIMLYPAPEGNYVYNRALRLHQLVPLRLQVLSGQNPINARKGITTRLDGRLVPPVEPAVRILLMPVRALRRDQSLSAPSAQR